MIVVISFLFHVHIIYVFQFFMTTCMLSTVSLLREFEHLKKTKVYFNHRGDKCDEIARGKFSKITETARLSGWEFEADNSPYSVYATRHWNWMNSYWMLWIGRLRGARSVSSFCDFRKITFRDLTRIFLLFDARKSCVFQIFLLRSIKAYLCPNIINFDSVNFSECRPEEVISFFWRSVYIAHSQENTTQIGENANPAARE